MNKFLTFIFLTLFSFNIIAQENSVNKAIYQNDTVIWFGSDFSLFRLVNKKRMVQEEKWFPYISAWNKAYDAYLSNVKIAGWVSAKKVINDKEFTTTAYKKNLPEDWIIAKEHTISRAEIEVHLKKYTSKHIGIGLTFIIESFYKGDPSLAHGYFVWFDIKSKTVLETFKVEGNPTSAGYYKQLPDPKSLPKDKGMIIYWTKGMVNCTINMSIIYKENDPFKEEKQY